MHSFFFFSTLQQPTSASFSCLLIAIMLLTHAAPCFVITCQQADLFKPNHYLSLLAFRELTLKRLQAFVAAKFSDGNGPPQGFDVRDYLNSACRAALCCVVLFCAMS